MPKTKEERRKLILQIIKYGHGCNKCVAQSIRNAHDISLKGGLALIERLESEGYIYTYIEDNAKHFKLTEPKGINMLNSLVNREVFI